MAENQQQAQFEQTATEAPAQVEQKKKSKAPTIILIVLSSLAVVFGGVYMTLRAMGKDPFSAPKPSKEVFVSDTEPEPASDSDFLIAVATTTPPTPPATTYPASTKPASKPTSSPASADKLAEAVRIRKLLVSKKWKSNIMGYDANLTFKNDGTAKISVKVLFVTQNVNGTYDIGDDCSVLIRFSYAGSKYRIIGTAHAVNDDKIVLTTKSGEKYTLTAA